MLFPVEGWPRTRTFFAGIERDEDTELRILDQRSCGGAFGDDERESSFMVKGEECSELEPRLSSAQLTTALLSSYRDTLMAPATAVPQHKLFESPNSRAIEIFDWTVTAHTGPISSAAHCEALQASLGIPHPEMMFGYNLLQIKHRPSGWTYSFRVEDALKGVKSGALEDGDGGVKVGYADAWLKSR